jgi:phage terminase large subunit-like protein
MPWQQHVADVAMELDPVTGKFVYPEVGLTVPRQSGKSTFVLAHAVHRCSATKFFGPRQRLVYTAQTRGKAREKFVEDYIDELQAAPKFRGRFHPGLSNGSEHLRFANRSRWGIEANTERAGHGGTLDVAYLDEAFAHQDSRLEQAFRPAMITRANKQLWWISTAGWSDASPYLQDKVTRGRELVVAGAQEGLAYFEWSAHEDADPEDPATWRGCMPALGYTVTEAAIAAEFLTMGLADFKRAYLNMWGPKHSKAATVIDMALWASWADADSTMKGKVRFAADATPDLGWASIGAAGDRPDGLGHLEVIEHQSGTGWLAARAAELQRKWNSGPIILDPTGPMGALLNDLDDAGVTYRKLSAREVVQACGGLKVDVEEGRVRHLDDPCLNTALTAAKKRPLGDAWAWARKDASVPISPLVAVTLARYGARNVDPTKSSPLDVAAHRGRSASDDRLSAVANARW